MSLATGLHRIDRATYDDLDRASWSIIKPMGRSPAHCLEALKGRESKALAQGIAGHLAVLEPDEFAKCAVWTGAVRRGKEWDAFRAANAGRVILTEDEALTAAALGKAVRSHKVAGRYLAEGEAELSVLWGHEGVDCKSRVDFRSGAGVLLELKTTTDASPRGFGAQVARLDYLGQAAMYADGFADASGERLPVVFVAVEKEPPYVVQCYRVPESLLLLGRNRYRDLLSRWAQCRGANSWPGYAENELELRLPPWAMAEDWTNGNTIE